MGRIIRGARHDQRPRRYPQTAAHGPFACEDWRHLGRML